MARKEWVGTLCSRMWLLLFVYLVVFAVSSVNSLSQLAAVRLNKVFGATHSRRQADTLIAAGRVAVNGQVVQDMGRRVVPYADRVELDGVFVRNWELRAVKQQQPIGQQIHDSSLPNDEDYIKFWKPVGVTSTTDRRVEGNLLDALEKMSKNQQGRKRRPIQNRVFSVGRLDKDSSGVLLLTSDGRVPDAVLRKEWKQPKVYKVMTDKPVLSSHCQQLRQGLMITTDKVRGGRHTQFSARTLPCQVEIDKETRRCLVMTLTEGRNRQIRVMLRTLGYRVVELHRVEFLGIGLDGLEGPGDWKRLNAVEQKQLDTAVAMSRNAMKTGNA